MIRLAILDEHDRIVEVDKLDLEGRWKLRGDMEQLAARLDEAEQADTEADPDRLDLTEQ